VIFYWIVLAWRRFVWFFKMPTAKDVAWIDPNAKCPACGACSGKLNVMTAGGKQDKETGAIIGGETVVQHTCNVCHASWIEPTIVKTGPQRVRETKAA
jgi:cytochrome c5